MSTCNLLITILNAMCESFILIYYIFNKRNIFYEILSEHVFTHHVRVISNLIRNISVA